jgi:elongation factor P hydroxylase
MQKIERHEGVTLAEFDELEVHVCSPFRMFCCVLGYTQAVSLSTNIQAEQQSFMATIQNRVMEQERVLKVAEEREIEDRVAELHASFVCIIGLHLMKDPVMAAGDKRV